MKPEIKTIVTYALSLCFVSMLAASFSQTPIFIGLMTLISFVSASFVMALLFGRFVQVGKGEDDE